MFGTISVLFMVQWQEWAIGPASFSTLIGLMAACRSDPYADASISCTCNCPHCCCLTNFCSPTTIYNHYTIFLRCAASYAAGQRYASSASYVPVGETSGRLELMGSCKDHGHTITKAHFRYPAAPAGPM